VLTLSDSMRSFVSVSGRDYTRRSPDCQGRRGPVDRLSSAHDTRVALSLTSRGARDPVPEPF